MIKTLSLVALTLSLAAPSPAHDEGHGPKLTDAGKMGGVVTSVVAAKDAKLGPKAAMLYKAELTRAEDGTVRVYLYDAAMKPLDGARFGKDAKAVLIALKRKGKKETLSPFKLLFKDGAFAGQAPKAASKPFNIDVTFTEGKEKLLAAFDNLD